MRYAPEPSGHTTREPRAAQGRNQRRAGMGSANANHPGRLERGARKGLQRGTRGTREHQHPLANPRRSAHQSQRRVPASPPPLAVVNCKVCYWKAFESDSAEIRPTFAFSQRACAADAVALAALGLVCERSSRGVLLEAASRAIGLGVGLVEGD